MKHFSSFLSQCWSMLLAIGRFLFGTPKPVVHGPDTSEVLPSGGPSTFEEQPEVPDHRTAGPSAISPEEEPPARFIGYWDGPELPPLWVVVYLLATNFNGEALLYRQGFPSTRALTISWFRERKSYLSDIVHIKIQYNMKYIWDKTCWIWDVAVFSVKYAFSEKFRAFQKIQQEREKLKEEREETVWG